MEAEKRIAELTRILQEANYKYYVLDDPSMQDFEYDRLLPVLLRKPLQTEPVRLPSISLFLP